jgi:hypothetical protein
MTGFFAALRMTFVRCMAGFFAALRITDDCSQMGRLESVGRE